MSQNNPRILFIQADDLEFSASKSWAFSCQYGLIEGIRNIGFTVDLFFSYQLETLEMRIKSIQYDYCIINCALHLLKNDLYFDEDRINLIKNSSKKLIGFMVEALHYYDEDGRQFQWSGDRLIGLKKYVSYFDAFATYNSNDIDFIKQHFLKPAYLFRPTLPLKYFNKTETQNLIKRRKSGKVVVVATIYGERREFLEKYSDILEVKLVYDRDIEFIYNRLTRLLFKRKYKLSIVIDKAIQWMIILLKKKYFRRYLKIIGSGTGVLHPFSYFPDIHCRYIEAIAAGNICFHPELSLPITDSMQYQMMKDIIYYNRDNFRDVFISATSDYIEFRRVLKSAYKTAIQSSTTEAEMRRLISIFENL